MPVARPLPNLRAFRHSRATSLDPVRTEPLLAPAHLPVRVILRNHGLYRFKRIEEFGLLREIELVQFASKRLEYLVLRAMQAIQSL